ncbi:hypothetical protein BJX65DRAFT_303179 [Aspergillus insuetus]
MATLTLYPNPLIAPPSYGEIIYSSGSSSSSSSSEARIRVRRSNRSSSATEAAPLPFDRFIEEDFRAGGPALCQPPVETITDIPSDIAQHKALQDPQKQHMQNMNSIATNAGVRVKEILYCGRRSAFARPRPNLRFTVLVYAERGNPTERGWINAARLIFQYLTRNGIHNVVVEIIDRRFDQRPSIFPCHPTDRIWSNWVRVSRDIINSIDLRVGVDAGIRANWQDLREVVIRVLDRYELGSVSILIRWDTLWLGARKGPSQPAPAGTTATEEDITDICPGTSLHPHSAQDGTATFGGWLELRWKDTKWQAYGVTCTHCVIPDVSSVAKTDALDVQRWTRDGIRFGASRAPEILQVDAPTKTFIRDRLDNLEEYIAEQIESASYKRIALFVEEEVEFEARDQKTWDTMNRRIALYRSMKATYKSMLERDNYVFGRVMAASGLRITRDTSGWNTDKSAYLEDQASNLDWALVKPHAGVAVSNKIPARTEKYNILPEDHFLIDFNFNALKHNDTLYKVGAQSGATRG